MISMMGMVVVSIQFGRSCANAAGAGRRSGSGTFTSRFWLRIAARTLKPGGVHEFVHRSAIRRVLGPGRGDPRLESVAESQQLLLGHDVLAAILEVILGEIRLDDGIDRAAFLAESAVDALEQVDVVARGAAGPVLALGRIDGDGQRRTDGLAKLAGNAALLAVRVAPQRVQSPIAR